MVSEINVNALYPHPKNPRRDLGDLSELIESIKRSGVMQNLTVVPREDEDGLGYTFTVLIGHRRLAAAKEAGLETVPCAVVEMSETEQLAAMLAENMQRTDLTLLEQAEGMQMMLDLGESIASVAERTGLSESTVRRRVKLAALPAEQVQTALDAGATLEDYTRAFAIENDKKREEVLKAVGSGDFNWRLREAENEQRARKLLAPVVAELKRRKAQKQKGSIWSVSGWERIETIPLSKEGQTEEQALAVIASLKDPIFWFESGNDIVFAEKQKRAKPVKKTPQEIARDRQDARIDELQKLAWQLRDEFVSGCSASLAKAREQQILGIYLSKLLTCYDYADKEDTAKLLGLDPKDKEAVKRYVTENPERTLLAATYSLLTPRAYEGRTWDRYGRKFVRNEKLEALYAYLTELGYVMSDEEEQLLGGTHPAYTMEELDERVDE